MPRRTKAEDIDDLVDDLEELDEVEDDFEDPDEAPKKKRTRSAKPKVEKTGIGTKEVAEELGIEPRQLRMFLRAQEIQPKGDREGRYHWASLDDPEVKRIIKAVEKGELEKLNKAKLAELKEKKTSKKD